MNSFNLIKRVTVALTVLFAVVLSALEVNAQSSGGFFETENAVFANCSVTALGTASGGQYLDGNPGFNVQTTASLSAPVCGTNGVVETGAAILDANFENVTNRISNAGTNDCFIRLKMEVTN